MSAARASLSARGRMVGPPSASRVGGGHPAGAPAGTTPSRRAWGKQAGGMGARPTGFRSRTLPSPASGAVDAPALAHRPVLGPAAGRTCRHTTVGGHGDARVGRRRISRSAAVRNPCWWPRCFPVRGASSSEGPVQGGHPLAREGLGPWSTHVMTRQPQCRPAAAIRGYRTGMPAMCSTGHGPGVAGQHMST